MHASSLFVGQLASLAPTLAIDIQMKGIQANAEDAVLAGFNPTITPQCGREPHLSFSDITLETEPSLGGVPFPFHICGLRLVGLSVSEWVPY